MDFESIAQKFQIPKIENAEHRNLFQCAFTHRSHFLLDGEDHKGLLDDYDRLEFLGDAILKFVINEKLYKLFPRYNSGSLTKLSAHLLRDKVLEKLGEELQLTPLVLTGRKVEAESVLDDVMEACFGAIYLSFGFPVIHELILRLYEPLIAASDADELKDNYKAALQELLQAGRRGLPHYENTNVTGPPHRLDFEMTVSVEGSPYGVGHGPSKKEASQLAAKEALYKLREEIELLKTENL